MQFSEAEQKPHVPVIARDHFRLKSGQHVVGDALRTSTPPMTGSRNSRGSSRCSASRSVPKRRENDAGLRAHSGDSAP